MCLSRRGKRQGHLVFTMDDTYNSTINFKIMRKKQKTKTANKENKIKAKTKKITTQQKYNTEKRNRQSSKRREATQGEY